MPRASNYTFLTEVRGEAGTSLAVYKPRRGETPLWDFPDGTLCNREVAAFLVSQVLGWPAVPPTVLRQGPHGPGSVQLFVEADPTEHYFTMVEAEPAPFRAIAAFDVVVNNADRKAGHCLKGADGTIWVVDHGVCFSVEPKLRTVIWEFAGDPIPDHLAEDLHRLAGQIRSGPLRGELLAQLTVREVDETARRAEALARSACFPMPGHRRSYPWPPV
jgi:uncharacterized repeat protein (TIGR03843 family)